jgi:hypothetical protein
VRRGEERRRVGERAPTLASGDLDRDAGGDKTRERIAGRRP